MTGSRAQLYNGILLLSSFFTCRLVYGTYQSYCVIGDLLRAVGVSPDIEKLNTAVMLFAEEKSHVPLWAALSYLTSNLTLNFLNFYWFFKMIQAIYKRFEPAGKPQEPVTEVEVDLSTVASGVPEKQQGRRRKA